jgi:2-oxoglutarate ferredoxin oxidoreductase subunit gamma
MPQYEVTFAGFGGQGIMTAGQLLAYTGIHEGKQVVWIPSYGPEMRGGTAYCTVVISDVRIGSPIINSPRGLVVFNRPSMDKFAPRVKPGGLLIVNSSLIDVVSGRSDVTELLIPANDMAIKAGSVKAVNMIMLGAFVGASSIVNYESLKEVVLQKMGRKKELLDINYEVIEAGHQLGLAVRQQETVK